MCLVNTDLLIILLVWIALKMDIYLQFRCLKHRLGSQT